jgi:hypothetical protein
VLERQEYAKKLYKLVSPKTTNSMQINCACLQNIQPAPSDKEQLKKQWAEKTIGTEKKTNQRWKLYQK